MSSDAPTPLDLDAIRRAEAHVKLDALGADLDLLIDVAASGIPADVLRPILRNFTRGTPAPAWDEDAAERAFTAAANAAANDETWAKASDHTKAWWRMVAQAALRDHLPVKPSRDDMLMTLARADGQDWESISDASLHTAETMYGVHATAVLDLWPGRSEATVKAEALREAADAVTEIDGRRDDAAARWLRDRADRLAAEGGDDRG